MSRPRTICALLAAALSAACSDPTVCERACERTASCGATACEVLNDCSTAEQQCEAQCVVEASCADIMASIVHSEPRGGIASCAERCGGGSSSRDAGVSDAGAPYREYQGYPGAGGPSCGVEPAGAHETARCDRGDTCHDAAARRCGTSPVGYYQAYPDPFGGGPICGQEPEGARSTARCEAHDNCEVPSARHCRRS